MTTVRKITLWFGSSLCSISLFSLLFGPGSFFLFRISAIFALPVACLYLPFLISFKDAEEGRIWSILVSGTLIGPASLFVRGLILALTGDLSVWQGDGMVPGLGAVLLLALLIGLVTSVFYVSA